MQTICEMNLTWPSVPIPWALGNPELLHLAKRTYCDCEIGASPYPVRQVETTNIQSLGIIAGSRELPLLIAREARRLGIPRIVAVAFHNETSPEIEKVADEVEWLRVGQLSRLIKAFCRRDVAHCVMAGQIAPKNLFDFRPDLKTAAMLFRLKERNAHTIFGAIGDELAKGGVTLIDALPWLGQAMPGKGFHIGPKLTRQQQDDIAFGCRMAKEVSRLEIGQSIVVKEGTVLAVEGFEGTDACLRRGGELAGPKGGAVAVKVASKNHDMRFDIPCIGRRSLESCAASAIAVLAVESSKTILLEREEVESLSQAHGITLTTVTP